MNEERFNACCDGCYYNTGCTNNSMTESGGETKRKTPPKTSNPNKSSAAVTEQKQVKGNSLNALKRILKMFGTGLK